MREIQAAAIEQAVYDLILEASYNIGPDVCEAVRRYRDAEPVSYTHLTLPTN